jgi:ribonuclease P protein component
MADSETILIPRNADIPARPAIALPAIEDKRIAGSLSSGDGPSRDWRLHRHADYQRVYKTTRKQHASLFTWFAVARAPSAERGPRVGLTAGRVLGNAVERNRIKRRMRAAVRENLVSLFADVDVVLHPKRSVLEAEFSALAAELRRIFLRIERETGLRGMDLPAATARSPESAWAQSTAGPTSQPTATSRVQSSSASMPGGRS